MSDYDSVCDIKGFTVEDILERIKRATNITTQAELAKKLGVRRAAVTDAKRRGNIPSDWLLKLSRLYNLNPVWMESGLGPMKISQDAPDFGGPGGFPATPPAEGCHDEFEYIPKVAAVPRMGPEGLQTDETIETYYAFRRQWLQRKGNVNTMRLMAVSGDSMEPTLRDGDIVLVDQSQKDVLFGKIYVLGIDDGIVVKRLDKRPGRLVLVSDNRDMYQPWEINMTEEPNIRIIGRVIWMAREII